MAREAVPWSWQTGGPITVASDTTREAARELLATQMQRVYQMPFEPFERHSPYGTPEDVAEFLRPYIEAGCSAFNVIPCAGDDESAIAGVGELRALLGASEATVTTG